MRTDALLGSLSSTLWVSPSPSWSFCSHETQAHAGCFRAHLAAVQSLCPELLGCTWYISVTKWLQVIPSPRVQPSSPLPALRGAHHIPVPSAWTQNARLPPGRKGPVGNNGPWATMEPAARVGGQKVDTMVWGQGHSPSC